MPQDQKVQRLCPKTLTEKWGVHMVLCTHISQTTTTTTTTTTTKTTTTTTAAATTTKTTITTTTTTAPTNQQINSTNPPYPSHLHGIDAKAAKAARAAVAPHVAQTTLLVFEP